MIHELLFIFSWLTPLLMAAAIPFFPKHVWRFLPVAGLVGVVTALTVPAGSMGGTAFLLLGTSFGLDQTGKGFLLFTTVVWTLAAWHATGYITRRRNSFAGLFLLAMAGNIGLIVAQDMLGFYLFFAVMSFSSYGLVIFENTPRVRYAGKIYIVLVIIGEMLIFSGMAGVAALSGSTAFIDIGGSWVEQPPGPLLFGALLLGFGIKAGALPLHVWLPLAHPAAPTPASAVLSGAMIKAGLLGWLRFLPVGEAVLPGWGTLCIALGVAALFGGALYGCFQSHPKSVLAYSSISKMGMMTMALGTILLHPAMENLMLACILVFATHHALCKGALFLGVSIDRDDFSSQWLKWFATLGLLIPPLSLIGVYPAGGALAKAVMKAGLAAAPHALPPVWLTLVMTTSGILTAALMLRFCYLQFTIAAKSQRPFRTATHLAWAALVVLVAATPLLLPLLVADGPLARLEIKQFAWSSFLPILITIGAGLLLIWYRFRVFPALPALSSWPAGDLLLVYDRVVQTLTRPVCQSVVLAGRLRWYISKSRTALAERMINMPGLLQRLEAHLGQAAVFGLVFIGLLTASAYILLGKL